MPILTVTLTPHPDTPTEAVHGISVRVSRMGTLLAATYVLETDLERVRVPAPGPRCVTEKLWQHTCFEMFVARQGACAYHEFNFAPSGEWAVYAFERYRERAPLADANALDPQVSVRRSAKKLELDALIRLDRLSPLGPGATLALALSAVVEDQNGRLSYWAIKHPPGRPDFHHADAFALELHEIRD